MDTLADWEIGYLTAHLNGPNGDSGHRVRLVGVTADPIRTMGGLVLRPDVLVGDLDPT